MTDFNRSFTVPGADSSGSSGPAAPSGQLPAVELELFERAKEAVAAIRGRGRQSNGQAGDGNTLALRHGLRSLRLLDHPDIATWHRGQVEATTADLGGESELSTLSRASVREAARLEVILATLGDELLEYGVLTGKGRTRSATMVYLQVLDRFVRVSGALGMQRRSKPVPTLADYLEQRAAAQQSEGA